MADVLTQTSVNRLSPAEKRYDVRDAKTRHLLVRVEPTGLITYYFSGWLGGKNRTAKIARASEITLHQARQAVQDIVAQGRLHAHGLAAAPVLIGKKDKRQVIPTLKEWIDLHYQPKVLQYKKSGTESLKTLERHFSSFLATRLDDPEILQRVMLWRDEKLRAGLAPVTINRIVSTFSSCLTEAVTREVIPEHPLRRLKPLKQPDNQRTRYLSPDEEQRLWDALVQREERIREERENANQWRRERGYAEMVDLRESPFADYLKPFVICALYTGARRGELFNLCWPDVDWESRTILIRAAAAKSGKPRRVPMNTVVLDTLRAWHIQMGGKGFVFASPKTGGRMNNISSSWERLMKDAGIEDFRFHDLRHHFASMLAMDGVPLNDIRELLGHATMTMTLRYAHLAPEHGHDAVARLALRHQKFQDGNITPFRKTENAEQES